MPRPDHTRALHAALLTAARGLPVIPLSRTKLPAVRSPHRDEPRSAAMCRGECGSPGHGVYDATTDPARIRALFAIAPWATGYGVACGRGPLHLIGIDLDVKHGTDGIGALHALAEVRRFTLPDTVTVLTPSGGRHLWLTAPGPVPNSAGRLAPGIDVRGEGGYVVGPGSRTVAGRYLLAPGTADRPLAAAPPELLRLAAPPPSPYERQPRHAAGPRHPAEKRAAALVRFVLDSHEGERNGRLFWAACRAYDAGLGDALAPALVTAAVHTGLSEREAAATVASAGRLRAAPHT
ncbi:bifunctional DNA primase/polymerase [Streptomyces cocklensis]|uniref:Bifunctional DNA primase/polymerase, N-terminal n=1 Tax=Actinacidiphila cocklensis TaxID=887465 RepID=A0A9W4GWX7_9ACTN|nr:bifunctional DNA primase/polymerase [Actinacidiphila cocklensis]MDD1057307.1 bifunctional DNA primase/polymerase [Actinacidiphila cocklensis]CAG6399418.1 Bifunctional DNA primase/polymerase, N-terminal [Actinacidiphila cocklensis]